MKEEKSHIIDKIADKGDGLTVPDKFFEDFAVKMAGQLPFREELDVPVARQKAPKNSTWMRVRPYVYMAAMFAGAWCLIKMFSLMSPATDDVSIDNYPSLSLALQQDEQFVEDYVIDDMSGYDLWEAAYMESMGYELDENYNYPDLDLSYTMDMTDDYAENDESPAYILPGGADYTYQN